MNNCGDAVCAYEYEGRLYRSKKEITEVKRAEVRVDMIEYTTRTLALMARTEDGMVRLERVARILVDDYGELRTKLKEYYREAEGYSN